MSDVGLDPGKCRSFAKKLDGCAKNLKKASSDVRSIDKRALLNMSTAPCRLLDECVEELTLLADLLRKKATAMEEIPIGAMAPASSSADAAQAKLESSLKDDLNSHTTPEIDSTVVDAANEFAEGDTATYTKKLKELAAAYQRQGMSKPDAERMANRRVDALLAAAIDERLDAIIQPAQYNVEGHVRPDPQLSALAAKLDFSKKDVALLASVRLSMIQSHYEKFEADQAKTLMETRKPSTEVWQGPRWVRERDQINRLQLNFLYIGGAKFEEVSSEELTAAGHVLNGVNGAAEPMKGFRPTQTYVDLANRFDDFWPGAFAKQLGKASNVVDVVTTGFDVWNQVERDRNNPNLTSTKKVFRGIVAAAPGAGGVGGAILGAKIGVLVTAETGPFAVVGGFVGGIIGGVVGSIAGKKLKEAAEKEFFPQDPPPYLKPQQVKGPPRAITPYDCSPGAVVPPPQPASSAQ